MDSSQYDAVAEVVRAAPAEEYRQRLPLTMPIPASQIVEQLALGCD